MNYLRQQMERLESDALALIVDTFYGCQRVAFEILRERGEIVPFSSQDGSTEHTNTEQDQNPSVAFFVRRRRK